MIFKTFVSFSFSLSAPVSIKISLSMNLSMILCKKFGFFSSYAYSSSLNNFFTLI